MFARLKTIGPGALVTAAFIGPGTITTCTIAGATFGFALLWALLFATTATIILQEMAARLGVVTGKGLGDILRETLEGSIWKWPLYALVIVSLYIGNCAYEAGNFSGAALGMAAIVGPESGDGGDLVFRLSVIASSLIAGGLLFFGGYRQIEKLLLALVALMAVSFVGAFIVVRPDIGAFARGLFLPRLPDGSLMVVIALIGTTVIPYNLFLHASAVRHRWTGDEALANARIDTVGAIGFGGLITIMIAATAATSALKSGLAIENAADMARQIEPLFGSVSRYLLGIGLFAAGLSSGVAAPLATGFAVSEIMGFRTAKDKDTEKGTGKDAGKGGGERSLKFRLIMLSVILSGAAVALTGIRPVTIILSAQFANGLLLPIIAGFLLFAMNRRKLLGANANSPLANVLGGAVVIITLGLGLRLVLRALGIL